MRQTTLLNHLNTTARIRRMTLTEEPVVTNRQRRNAVHHIRGWDMTQRREIEYCRPPPQRSTPDTDTVTTSDALPLEQGHVYPEDVLAARRNAVVTYRAAGRAQRPGIPEVD